MQQIGGVEPYGNYTVHQKNSETGVFTFLFVNFRLKALLTF